jgi:hypothetical protein
MRGLVVAISLSIVSIPSSLDASPRDVDVSFFETKIRPVLAEHCYKCHSSKKKKPKAGLLLDSRDGWLRGGESGPAVVPGKPEESSLLHALREDDEDLRMPPRATLPEEVIADFERWIVAGAPSPETKSTAASEQKPVRPPWWERIDPARVLPKEKNIAEVIDHHVAARLAAKRVEPMASADEATLVRRVTLDLDGRIPTTRETRAYVESDDPEKKTELVDQLIQAPGFIRHQSSELDALLAGDGKSSMTEYFSRALQEGRGWDRMFREIIEARPDSDDTKSADRFLRSRVRDTDALTVDVSVLFFGVNIGCARCHDHPEVPSWKQDHYFGMKSFFNRSFENGGFVAERETGLVSFKTTKGEKRDAKLMFLSGDVVDEPEPRTLSKEEAKKQKAQHEKFKKEKKPLPPPSFSRRQQLIEVGLDPKHAGFFARSLVNRIWHRLIGHGLVMPLDQMHGENSPSHPELLLWLARDLVDHDYDIRRLIRGIVLSETYSRSSRWPVSERPDRDLFAVANPRALTPRQYGASLRIATTDPEVFGADVSHEEIDKRLESAERGGERFANGLERPGERFQVSVDEALLFSNDSSVRRDLLRDNRDSLLGRLKSTRAQDDQIRAAVWAVLSRPAADEEMREIGKYLERRSDRSDEGWRQVVWALLTSTEMRFNH